MNYYMVLGNKSKNGLPSADMCARVEYLYARLKLTDEPAHIILSGANGEAELMHKVLMNYVPSAFLEQCHIISDIHSMNTIQSIQYLKEHEILPAIVLTSDYHVNRVRCIARKLKYPCAVIGAPTYNELLWKSFWEMIFYITTAIFPLSLCTKFSKIRKTLHLK